LLTVRRPPASVADALSCAATGTERRRRSVDESGKTLRDEDIVTVSGAKADASVLDSDEDDIDTDTDDSDADTDLDDPK
jgi:hypothetical protein